MTSLIQVILFLGVVYAIYFIVRSFLLIKVGVGIVKKHSPPFEKDLKIPRYRILCLGDSTMVAVGVQNLQNSLPALISKEFPNASVENCAEVGGKVENLVEQLNKADKSQYDLIVVATGANDIVQVTQPKKLDNDLHIFLSLASKSGRKIILTHCPNVGNMRMFIFPLNYFYSAISKRLSKIYSEVSSQFKNVFYVNFYRPLNNDFIGSDYKDYYAPDLLHPNDKSHIFFFNLLKQELKMDSNYLLQ